MTSPSPQEHALRILLEEKLGGHHPPDLRHEILRRADRPARPLPSTDDELATPTETRPQREPAMHLTSQSETFDDATQAGSHGLLHEFCGFMSENAKWWLVPFLVVFCLLGFALALGSTGVAPFIYTMF